MNAIKCSSAPAGCRRLAACRTTVYNSQYARTAARNARFRMTCRSPAGDRILVDKLGPPRRWDPVVFRYPTDIHTNYLHRLVGLPGETVEIIGGDVFIDGSREAKPFGVARDLWIVVNDTRYRPGELKADDPQWRPAESSTHWRWDQRGWTFEGIDSVPEQIHFTGPLTDESFYAERWSDDPPSWPGDEPKLVGDLQITCTIRRFSGEGEMGFRWAFRGLEASASLRADGFAELRADTAAWSGNLPQPLAAVKEVSFAVRDGVVTLIADGHELTSLLIGEQEADRVRDLDDDPAEPCRISIAAEHCSMELARIVVERDVY